MKRPILIAFSLFGLLSACGDDSIFDWKASEAAHQNDPQGSTDGGSGSDGDGGPGSSTDGGPGSDGDGGPGSSTDGGPGSDGDGGPGSSTDGGPGSDGDGGTAKRCDPLKAGDCPSDHKCVLEADNGPVCLLMGTTKARGEVCKGTDCAAGLICARTRTSTSTTSTCQTICNFETNDGCSDLGTETETEYSCAYRVQDRSPYGTCGALGKRCTPFPDTCDGKQACQIIDNRGTQELRCVPPGQNKDNEVCAQPGESCAKGYGCVAPSADTSGNSVCRKYCSVDADCADVASTTCTGRLAVNDVTVFYCDKAQ